MEKRMTPQDDQAKQRELELCNCDGFWHVEVDGLTFYVDEKSVEQVEVEARLDEVNNVPAMGRAATIGWKQDRLAELRRRKDE